MFYISIVDVCDVVLLNDRHSWLRHHRVEVPSVEEMRLESNDNEKIQQKISDIKQIDHKLRMQEMAERHLEEQTLANNGFQQGQS